MPYDLFWNGEPELVKTYEKAHEMRKAEVNQEMWAQGMYVYRAVKNVIENFALGLSGGKGSKPEEYPKEPIPFTKMEQEQAVERNKERTMKWVQDNQK